MGGKEWRVWWGRWTLRLSQSKLQDETIGGIRTIAHELGKNIHERIYTKLLGMLMRVVMAPEYRRFVLSEGVSQESLSCQGQPSDAVSRPR